LFGEEKDSNHEVSLRKDGQQRPAAIDHRLVSGCSARR